MVESEEVSSLPLQSWTCDSCGGQIDDANMSLVVWREDEQGRGYDYQIVHKNTDGRKCDPGDQGGFEDSLEVSNFLGPNGASELLAMLSNGPIANSAQGMPEVANFDQFVDLFRRLQTPWYEEARSRFAEDDIQEDFGSASPAYPYHPDNLERIAKG